MPIINRPTIVRRGGGSNEPEGESPQREPENVTPIQQGRPADDAPAASEASAPEATSETTPNPADNAAPVEDAAEASDESAAADDESPDRVTPQVPSKGLDAATPAPARAQAPRRLRSQEKPAPEGDGILEPPSEFNANDRQGTVELRQRLHRRLIEEIDLDALAQMADNEARSQVEDAAREIIQREVPTGLGGFRDRLLEQLVDDILGLGPIEPLLREKSVSEIMVNGANHVYVERAGKLLLTGVQFRDDTHVVHVIERILSSTGRTIDEANPMVDARLSDGSRVNAVIPPASISGPLLTIRKFVADKLTAEDLIQIGTLSEDSAALMSAAVDVGLNILVSGGTGSGKTTLLNVLSSWIPSTHRILTIEDPPELRLRQPHVLTLEARPALQPGQRAVDQAALLKNSLRMRPDRIIVGECRGSEAFDMLQAMNTGHEGSMSTVHANTPRDAARRIENMVMMAGFDLPAKAIREQIASAIDVIVQISRMRDGSRRVVAISEIAGMEDTTVTMQDLFRYDYRRNELVATGLRPTFSEKLEAHGYELSAVSSVDEENSAW
jgi:pilus assembly protein CpaF